MKLVFCTPVGTIFVAIDYNYLLSLYQLYLWQCSHSVSEISWQLFLLWFNCPVDCTVSVYGSYWVWCLEAHCWFPSSLLVGALFYSFSWIGVTGSCLVTALYGCGLQPPFLEQVTCASNIMGLHWASAVSTFFGLGINVNLLDSTLISAGDTISYQYYCSVFVFSFSSLPSLYVLCSLVLSVPCGGGGTVSPFWLCCCGTSCLKKLAFSTLLLVLTMISLCRAQRLVCRGNSSSSSLYSDKVGASRLVRSRAILAVAVWGPELVPFSHSGVWSGLNVIPVSRRWGVFIVPASMLEELILPEVVLEDDVGSAGIIVWHELWSFDTFCLGYKSVERYPLVGAQATT